MKEMTNSHFKNEKKLVLLWLALLVLLGSIFYHNVGIMLELMGQNIMVINYAQMREI